MDLRSPARSATACVVALALTLGVSACGKKHEPGEPLREGLSQPINGLRYTVFLTRQLNLRNTEDKGYVPGTKEAEPGHGLFGVFLQACNTSKKTATAVTLDSFKIVDAQGVEYFPEHLQKSNPFAYQGGPVLPENCEPARGSLAQQGPTSGALLLFDLPLAATENRPLELRIDGQPAEAIVTLDI